MTACPTCGQPQVAPLATPTAVQPCPRCTAAPAPAARPAPVDKGQPLALFAEPDPDTLFGDGTLLA